MFNSLTGIITGKFPKHIYLQTQGIEWDIIVPDSCLDEFPLVGSECKVYTWLNHTENGMDLFGFAKQEERFLFFDVMKVDGIGAKGAIKIMSSVSYQDLVTALDGEDVSVLEKIQGIGKKTAAKMMLTLKGKLTIPENANTNYTYKAGIYSVVVKSLIDMGYEKQEADEVVSRLSRKYSKEIDFEQKSQTEKEDFLFRVSLVELAR